jgi:integrase
MLKISKRGKKGIWQIAGTVGGQRYRESTGTHSEPHAQVLLAKRQAEILDRITWGEKRTSFFAEAVILYLNQGGEARFVDKLNDRFGLKRMSEITHAEVSRFAVDAYPGTLPQTLNRHVYTPLIAIYRAAHVAGMCEAPAFARPKIPKRKAVTYARDEFIAQLLPHCGDRLRAAVLLVSFTGARASEACRLKDGDIDWRTRHLTLRDTKPGTTRVVAIADVLFDALLPLRDRSGRVLGYASRYSLNQALARACRRAGLPVLTSHKIGRHAFAARLFAQGRRMKEVAEARGWKSTRMHSLPYQGSALPLSYGSKSACFLGN